MSSTAASANGASETAIEAVVPASIEVSVAGLNIQAVPVAVAEKVNEAGETLRDAGIRFTAKVRRAIKSDNTKSDGEILASLVGRVAYALQAMVLGSKYVSDSGSVIVGKEADRKDKAGGVLFAGRPQIVFRSVDTLGGVEYQILAKCRVGSVKAGRYLEVVIDATRTPQGRPFSEVGEVDGEFDI